MELLSAASNTITGSYIANPQGYAAWMVNSMYNTISGSTMTTIAGTDARSFWASMRPPGTSITQSFMTARERDYGSDPRRRSSNSNTISLSTMTSGIAGFSALYLNGASSNSVTQSNLANPAGTGAVLTANANNNTISQSTVTSNADDRPRPLSSANRPSNTFSDDYIQGSTAVYVSGSAGTVIGGSVLVATNTAGRALQMDGGSVNLSLSSSVLTAGVAGVAVFLGAGDGGLLVLSTNTFSGAAYGVYAASPTATAQIWITSNTIVPAVTSANNTYGLYFNGLASGATIENNTVAYRTPNTMGANTSYALYAQSAAGLVIDHNRFNEPGMITGGSYVAVSFAGTTNSAFKFNDVNSTGTALHERVLARGGDRLDGADGQGQRVPELVRLLVVGLVGDRDRGRGEHGVLRGLQRLLQLELGVELRVGHGGQAGPGGVEPASSGDAHSISANPLWFNASAGVEDFHPMSLTGRWNQAAQNLLLVDGAQSLTIDAGDPAEGVGLEPSPNGGVANQGSYGLTAQASKSSGRLRGLRRDVERVGVGQPYATISAAVGALPDHVRRRARRA